MTLTLFHEPVYGNEQQMYVEIEFIQFMWTKGQGSGFMKFIEINQRISVHANKQNILGKTESSFTTICPTRVMSHCLILTTPPV